jgi:hypothetical protein
MLQATLSTDFRKFRNFLGFARTFFLRKNPIKAFSIQLIASIKDFLTMNKKLKMSKYRLNYNMYKLNKMETLIAENNEHAFLRGRKINEVR